MKSAASPQELELLQTSLDWIRPVGHGFAHRFFETLFESHPTVRSIFPEKMERQEERLIEMLVYLIDGMGNFGKIEPLVENLGRRHIAYGVKPEHYAMVGEALITTLKEFAGDRWTEDVERVWTRAYQTLSDKMPK